jgi:REP-associated tyrosine transposase
MFKSFIIMSRYKRINLPFCLYHVISRANSGDIAFCDRKDKIKFLEYLARYLELYECRLHAFCLMDTHFHLLIESGPRAALSELMHRLMTAYTVYYNRRYNRHGHLFQGRFNSYIVDKADYLLTLSRYIHLNPYHTKSSDDPLKYFGSSLSYYVRGNEPDYLHTGEILSWFKGDRKEYERYVLEDKNEEIMINIHQQRFIGGEIFCTRMRKRFKHKSDAGTSIIAKEKSRAFCQEKEEKKAEIILEKVAEYYDLQPEMIKAGYRAKGDTAKARIVVIGLLRINLPWTGKQISSWLGMKKNIYGYLKKLKEKEDLRKAYDSILKVIQGIV